MKNACARKSWPLFYCCLPPGNPAESLVVQLSEWRGRRRASHAISGSHPPIAAPRLCNHGFPPAAWRRRQEGMCEWLFTCGRARASLHGRGRRVKQAASIATPPQPPAPPPLHRRLRPSWRELSTPFTALPARWGAGARLRSRQNRAACSTAIGANSRPLLLRCSLQTLDVLNFKWLSLKRIPSAVALVTLVVALAFTVGFTAVPVKNGTGRDAPLLLDA